MLFDQSFLSMVLIATFLGLSGFVTGIYRIVKTYLVYSWSKR
jgi:hypothetical protein